MSRIICSPVAPLSVRRLVRTTGCCGRLLIRTFPLPPALDLFLIFLHQVITDLHLDGWYYSPVLQNKEIFFYFILVCDLVVRPLFPKAVIHNTVTSYLLHPTPHTVSGLE